MFFFFFFFFFFCYLAALWHQWLRYIRPEAPSLQEQQQDVIRQIQMKQLARLADERWASKPSFLDKPPTTQHPEPATLPNNDATMNAPQDRDANVEEAHRSETSGKNAARKDKARRVHPDKKDPWAQARGAPSENWQPDSWSPTASQR